MQVLVVVGLARFSDDSERFVGGSIGVSPHTALAGAGPEFQILRDSAVASAKSLGRLRTLHVAHGLGKSRSARKARNNAYQIAMGRLSG
jgi:hypothetical protein